MSFADWIENNQQGLIDRLAEVVVSRWRRGLLSKALKTQRLVRGSQRIPSVSGDAAYRPHVFQMAEWLLNALKALGVE